MSANNPAAQKSCKQRLLILDIYKEPIRLVLPDGKGLYRTSCGAILTLFTITVLVAYAVFKIEDLIDIKDYAVQETSRFEFFKNSAQFGYDDGFAFAAGLSKWDDGQGLTEDPQYGQMKIYIKSWGINAPFDELFYELETRACTEKDFGYDSEEGE